MIFDQHVCILGTTSSGKTVLATKLFKDFQKICIFFNTQQEIYPERYADAIVSTVPNLLQRLKDNKKKIVFNPGIDQKEKEEDLAKIQHVLFQIGEQINSASQRNIWCYFFVDEAHLFGDKKGIPALNGFFTNGLRYGVLTIAISQRPANLSHTVLTQSGIHILFYMNEFEAEYLEKTIGLDYNSFESWTTQDYHFMVKQGKINEFREPVEL